MSTAGTTNSKKRIPEGWHLVRLGDVTQFQQGGTPPKVHMEYWDGDIPFVTGADLRGIYISRSNARSFLTKAGLHSGATAICEKGALLLATRTRVGLVGIAGELMGASQDITLLAPTEAADRSYLCRTLINNAGLLQQQSRGTTIQGVSREDIDSLPILLPPLPEQRAIAAVLDSIDDAIERTEAVIAATGQLRDSLLHQLLTRGVPGWHTEWKEAPGLGTIPAGWEVVRLGEMAEVIMGQSPPGHHCNRAGEGIPLLNGPTEYGPYHPIPMQWTTDLRKRSSVGDILFCVRGATAGRMNWADRDYAIGRGIAAFRHHAGPLYQRFLRAIVDFKLPGLLTVVTGSTFPNLSYEQITQLRVPGIPLPEQQAIAGLLDGLDETLDRARTERAGLQLLKESTADALLTGRVRVKECIREK